MLKKRLSKAAIAVSLGAALVFGGATAANATTEYVGGGTWKYGVEKVGGTNWMSYSNFYHGSQKHRSTACVNYTDCTRSADRYGGVWAKASAFFNGGPGARAYWYVY